MLRWIVRHHWCPISCYLVQYRYDSQDSWDTVAPHTLTTAFAVSGLQGKAVYHPAPLQTEMRLNISHHCTHQHVPRQLMPCHAWQTWQVVVTDKNISVRAYQPVLTNETVELMLIIMIITIGFCSIAGCTLANCTKRINISGIAIDH